MQVGGRKWAWKHPLFFLTSVTPHSSAFHFSSLVVQLPNAKFPLRLIRRIIIHFQYRRESRPSRLGSRLESQWLNWNSSLNPIRRFGLTFTRVYQLSTWTWKSTIKSTGESTRAEVSLTTRWIAEGFVWFNAFTVVGWKPAQVIVSGCFCDARRFLMIGSYLLRDRLQSNK